VAMNSLPLVPDRMEIGVADAAEENFDLHVAVSWIATIDFKWRPAPMSRLAAETPSRCR